MRHAKNTRKLGRTTRHREALLANLVISLINHSRIKTTLAKAKSVRPLAEQLVTLGKKGSLHHRRLAIAKLGQSEAVSKLFKDIAPKFKERNGGYTRIIKLGPRDSDSAPTAFIEWVETEVAAAPAAEETAKPAKAKKTSSKAKKTEAPAAAEEQK